LEQIGLLKLPFLEHSVLSEPNGNLKAASGSFNAFGGIVARTNNTCGHVNSKNLSRWNQDRTLNLQFWSSHQEFRTYNYGATHPILDLGLKAIPSLLDEGGKIAIDEVVQRLQVLGTSCEGGAFVRLTLWDRFSSQFVEFLNCYLNLQACSRQFFPIFLFQNLLHSKSSASHAGNTHQFSSCGKQNITKVILPGYYCGSGNNFIYVSGLINGHLVQIV
jgi:hypothetical protein